MRIVKECTPYFKFSLEKISSEAVGEYCRFLTQSFGWYDIAWQERKWRFNDPQIASMIKEKFPETEVNIDIEGELIDRFIEKEREREKVENIRRIKEGGESKIEIKGIKGDLYNYQKLGVEFFINSNGRAILADSPGVGKTAQALGYIAHSGKKRSLIVCPASVKFSWENEIKKWTNLKSYIIESQTKFAKIPHDTNIVIINYDVLKKNFNKLIKYKFDICVFDEAQYLKSSESFRSKISKQLARNIPHVIMLTGTPILSRPIEMFNMLNMIDPVIWKNYYSYAKRYCGGVKTRYGFEAKGAENLDELRERIESYFLRRTKEEVLKELPPKNKIEIPINLSPEYRKKYDLVESDLVKYLNSYKQGKTSMEIARMLQAERLVKLNILREINTMGKLEAAKEIIDTIIESGEKALIFSSFNSPLKELHNFYKEKSVILIGETSIKDRGEIVKNFQEKSDIQLFFGGTKSAGCGITLTAASNVICLDLPWCPSDTEQQINRAHRPGAIYESLNIYTIISRDSIDDFMVKLLQKKQEIIDQVFGDKEEEKKEDIIDEYIDSLKLKYKK